MRSARWNVRYASVSIGSYMLNLAPSRDSKIWFTRIFAGPGLHPTYVLQTISKLAATATNPFLAIAPNNSTSPLVPDTTHCQNPPLHPQSHHHQNPAPPTAAGKFSTHGPPPSRVIPPDFWLIPILFCNTYIDTKL